MGFDKLKANITLISIALLFIVGIILSAESVQGSDMFTTRLTKEQRERKEAEEKEVVKLDLLKRKVAAMERANDLEYSRQNNRYRYPVRVNLHVYKTY